MESTLKSTPGSTTFTRELVANLADNVYFFRLNWDLDSDDTSCTFNLNDIHEGVVTKISGTNDMNICLTVRCADGQTFSACQEAFSINLKTILDIYNTTGGVIHKCDWVAEITSVCKDHIEYPYQIEFPFEQGQFFSNVYTEWGVKRDVSLTRCLFDLECGRYGTRIEYQLSPISCMVYTVKHTDLEDIVPCDSPYIITRR